MALYELLMKCLILLLLAYLLKRACNCANGERQRYYVDLEADRALRDPSVASIHVEAGPYKKIIHKKSCKKSPASPSPAAPNQDQAEALEAQRRLEAEIEMRP